MRERVGGRKKGRGREGSFREMPREGEGEGGREKERGRAVERKREGGR